MKKFSCNNIGCTQPLYGLGFIGALVFYLQHSVGILGFILAFLKAIVWPAFMVYDLLNYLH